MDNKPSLMERICEMLTHHKCCKDLGNGYKVCQICGKVYRADPVLPLPKLADQIKEDIKCITKS